MDNDRKELLEAFAKKFIEKSRDFTIHEEMKIIEGSSKSPASKKLHGKLKNFAPEHIEVLRDFIIDSIDGALNNFLWYLEQEDLVDLIFYKKNKPYSLKEISDGLSVDYWNYVDEFSKYKRTD